MRRVDPPAFMQALKRIGSVLDMTVYEEADFRLPALAAAIAQTLDEGDSAGTADRLLDLGAREISREALLGSWWDPDRAVLVYDGTIGNPETGASFERPTIFEREAAKKEGYDSGGHNVPGMDQPGNLAYAYFSPPYGLRGSAREIQNLFDRLLNFLFPPGETPIIHDWKTPDLADVSGYFRAGLEWWGVFLFTIAHPQAGRVIVLMASTTD